MSPLPLNDTNTDKTVRFLKSVPLLKCMSDKDLKEVAHKMKTIRIHSGTMIFSQGDLGDSFYVIQSGDVVVKKQEIYKFSVNSKVCISKTNGVHFSGVNVQKGSIAVVDKYDPAREYPYTIRICETGQRGRVLPTEIEQAGRKNEERIICRLKEGDSASFVKSRNSHNRGNSSVFACRKVSVDWMKSASVATWCQADAGVEDELAPIGATDARITKQFWRKSGCSKVSREQRRWKQ